MNGTGFAATDESRKKLFRYLRGVAVSSTIAFAERMKSSMPGKFDYTHYEIPNDPQEESGIFSPMDNFIFYGERRPGSEPSIIYAICLQNSFGGFARVRFFAYSVPLGLASATGPDMGNEHPLLGFDGIEPYLAFFDLAEKQWRREERFEDGVFRKLETLDGVYNIRRFFEMKSNTEMILE